MGRARRVTTVAPQPGIVYVVATPIGNLEDLSTRALRVMREVALLACEDTRHTARICARFGIGTPRISLFEHNEARRTGELLDRLAAGDSVAVVSDAGTPVVSDPGARFVARAIDAGFSVVSIPGPSAVLAALASSGFAGVPFHFCGFLPRKGAERRNRLAEMATWPGTLVIFEAPGRVARTLEDLHEALGPRRAVVARELTKRYEELLRGALGDLDVGEVRGEVTLVVEGPAPGDAAHERADADLEALIAELVASGRAVSDIAREVARRSRLSRSEAYARVEAFRREGGAA